MIKIMKYLIGDFLLTHKKLKNTVEKLPVIFKDDLYFSFFGRYNLSNKIKDIEYIIDEVCDSVDIRYIGSTIENNVKVIELVESPNVKHSFIETNKYLSHSKMIIDDEMRNIKENNLLFLPNNVEKNIEIFQKDQKNTLSNLKGDKSSIVTDFYIMYYLYENVFYNININNYLFTVSVNFDRNIKQTYDKNDIQNILIHIQFLLNFFDPSQKLISRNPYQYIIS